MHGRIVRDGVKLVLASVGVGLLIFSIFSLGYARSSDQDAAVLDQAMTKLARSLEPSPRFFDRLSSVCTVPLQFLQRGTHVIISTVLFPFRVLHRILARIGYTGSAFGKATDSTISWVSETASACAFWIINSMQTIAVFIGHKRDVVASAVRGPMVWIAAAVGACASFVNNTFGWLWSSCTGVYQYVAPSISGMASSGTKATKDTAGAFMSFVVTVYERLVASIFGRNEVVNDGPP